MVNKRLFNLLETFDKKEFSEFEKFAASPYFSRGRNVILMLGYLKKLHPHYPAGKLAPELIHHKLYPGKKYSEDAIKMQLSALTGLCKDFLHVSHYIKKAAETKLNLLSELQTRNIDNIFNEEINLLSKNMASESKITLENIRSFVKFQAINITRLQSKGDYTGIAEELILSGDHSAVDSLISLAENAQSEISFRNSYTMKNVKGLSEEIIDNINLEKLILFITAKKPVGYEMVLFYINRLMFYKTNGEYSYFKKLKEIFLVSWKKYSHYEVYSMLVNLANCCWWQIKTGNNKYKTDLFEVYKFWVNSGCLNKPGSPHIEIQLFKNIYNLALSMKELKWSENFLRHYSEYLNPAYSVDITNYSYALLYYVKKNYDKSLEMLIITKHQNYIYKIDCQTLMLKIYFETGSAESLFSLADSFKHFLNKHKSDNPVLGTRHLNFVKALIKLQKVTSGFNERKFDSLKQFLANEKLITEKDWLMYNAEQLENQKRRTY
jgi:hypothetical protein